jgi:hypothetical protein
VLVVNFPVVVFIVVVGFVVVVLVVVVDFVVVRLTVVVITEESTGNLTGVTVVTFNTNMAISLT